MKARKLIAEFKLRQCAELVEMGVPIAKIIKDKAIDMTAPTFSSLVDHYNSAHKYTEDSPNVHFVMMNSLFPPWLSPDDSRVQIQPQNWKYIGRFPLGAWQELKDNENN